MPEPLIVHFLVAIWACSSYLYYQRSSSVAPPVWVALVFAAVNVVIVIDSCLAADSWKWKFLVPSEFSRNAIFLTFNYCVVTCVLVRRLAVRRGTADS